LEWWTLDSTYRIWRKLSIEIHFLDFDADLYDQINNLSP
jgi:FAD synthase